MAKVSGDALYRTHSYRTGGFFESCIDYVCRFGRRKVRDGESSHVCNYSLLCLGDLRFE